MPITELCGLLKLLRNRLLTASGELYRTVYLGVGVTTRAYGPFAARFGRLHGPFWTQQLCLDEYMLTKKRWTALT